jgi:hypothetical protein
VFSDRADLNSKRFLGIYKDEKQTRGIMKGSMLRVAWQFCKTRVIFSTVFYSISIFFELLAPVLFLTLTLDILEEESLKVNGTLINVNETSNEVTFLIQFFQVNKNNLNVPDSSNGPYKNVQTLRP